MKFKLNNNDRKYLGLAPIEEHWEQIKLTNEIDLYFDGDIVKKAIVCSESHYHEREMNELTSENRTLLMPKTKKGKAKKLNYSSFSKRTGTGMYFKFDKLITIANYATQTSFLTYSFDKEPNFNDLRNWLNNFISETTQADLDEINRFKIQERKHVKYKEGDFFRFKIDRRNYAYGRILFDVSKYRKTNAFKAQNNYGLANLMGKILIIKIYHKLDNKNIAIEELKNLKALPSQYIMDNRFYYGEFEIIGNLPLKDEELDFPISYSKSINYNDLETFYLQYGKTYKETKANELDENLIAFKNKFRYERTGFSITINKKILEECIQVKSNKPYWESNNLYFENDLRNPKNSKEKEMIFQYFKM